MARHSQRFDSAPTGKFICEGCRKQKCEMCIDKARQKLVDHDVLEPGPKLCKCTRREHNMRTDNANT